ncbi:MAG: hypothetical protein JJ850_15995 [Kordiimonadaceae bacterium]|nr:hypothetical protein [Kordiimonadaceae bacterium]MBO6569590.1 hypothetical protein [Kordiimonadaceae bacterium]MBO6966125.1 hypothetical protein [Kordiimonadaceae bacterium]
MNDVAIALCEKGPIISDSSRNYKRNTLIVSALICLVTIDAKATFADLQFFGVSLDPYTVIWGSLVLILYNLVAATVGVLSDYKVWKSSVCSIHPSAALPILWFPLALFYAASAEQVIRFKSVPPASLSMNSLREAFRNWFKLRYFGGAENVFFDGTTIKRFNSPSGQTKIFSSETKSLLSIRLLEFVMKDVMLPLLLAVAAIFNLGPLLLAN